MINPFFQTGPFSVHWYGVIIALSIGASYLFARQKSADFGFKRENVDEALLVIIPAGLFGARLYHVLHYWDYYRNHFGEIIAIWQGGIGIWGALIFGFLALYLYLKIKKLPVFKALDLLALALIFGQALGRFGNFVNTEAFGPPTDFFLKIYVPPDMRPLGFSAFEFFHPTFFYEGFLEILGFFFLLFIANKFKNILPGYIFASYLIFYGLVRFFIEFLRVDTWMIGEAKTAQILSLASILLGIFLLGFFKNRPQKA